MNEQVDQLSMSVDQLSDEVQHRLDAIEERVEAAASPVLGPLERREEALGKKPDEPGQELAQQTRARREEEAILDTLVARLNAGT